LGDGIDEQKVAANFDKVMKQMWKKCFGEGTCVEEKPEVSIRITGSLEAYPNLQDREWEFS